MALYRKEDLPDVTFWGGVFPGGCMSSHSDRRHGRSPGSVWSPRTRPSATPWAWPRTADTSCGPGRASSPGWWGKARSENQTPRITTDFDIEIKMTGNFHTTHYTRGQGATSPTWATTVIHVTLIELAFECQIQNI